MPFQVKATVVRFLGDEETYPCHFLYKIGEEFIYDGEKYMGRICPSVARLLIPAMMPFHAAGPRAIPPSGYYYPFWYAPVSRKDPSLAKYDGLGFRNVLETAVEAPYHMANLAPAHAFEWPPDKERTVSKEAGMVICPDIRTSVLLKVEAFDLSDKGYDVPYFRREMVILDRVLKKPGIATTAILNEFSKQEIDDIYPALSQVMIDCLNEELVLVKFLEIKDGKAFVTDKGRKRLEGFKAGLTVEERKAINI